MIMERTGLPGLGISHQLTTREGNRLGVVSHLDGRHVLVLYDRTEPEQAVGTVTLRPDDARTVADVLHATVTVDHVADLVEPADGVRAARIRIRAGSAYADRPLGDTRARSRTGASIVSVLRGAEVNAAPGPNFVFRAADVVVAVGHEDGLLRLRDLLAAAG
ncbi:TrkA C-terminal domain-containing protein [Micromonospora sp. WMMD1102]|uniref:cation:proton antiporter regulatory subunit n=1 Tax=Micromonospora sp. WMMD1102 TaxID=3016105 RepID=UPI0024151DC6|nr:TrkA C-terminal domain-containing protein [Micromonospora sp. WMMD1102]MDG4787800.1 TrkA C-terminal domain-containing protein [Micromonospora sp. WMMD1102]